MPPQVTRSVDSALTRRESEAFERLLWRVSRELQRRLPITLELVTIEVGVAHRFEPVVDAPVYLPMEPEEGASS